MYMNYDFHCIYVQFVCAVIHSMCEVCVSVNIAQIMSQTERSHCLLSTHPQFFRVRMYDFLILYPLDRFVICSQYVIDCHLCHRLPFRFCLQYVIDCKSSKELVLEMYLQLFVFVFVFVFAHSMS